MSDRLQVSAPSLAAARFEALLGSSWPPSAQIRRCDNELARGKGTEMRKSAVPRSSPRVLVVDVGGTHVKVLATGQRQHRRFDSGPMMTPKQMVAQGKRILT